MKPYILLTTCTQTPPTSLHYITEDLCGTHIASKRNECQKKTSLKDNYVQSNHEQTYEQMAIRRWLLPISKPRQTIFQLVTSKSKLEV